MDYSLLHLGGHLEEAEVLTCDLTCHETDGRPKRCWLVRLFIHHKARPINRAEGALP